MPAHLLSLTDGPSILVDKPILLFGRHQECDVMLNSKKISRKHCAIAQVEGYLVIRDLGSTNGIKINGERNFGAIVDRCAGPKSGGVVVGFPRAFTDLAVKHVKPAVRAGILSQRR